MVTRLGLLRWPQTSSVFHPHHPEWDPPHLPGALLWGMPASEALPWVSIACFSAPEHFLECQLGLCGFTSSQKSLWVSSVLLCLLIDLEYNLYSFSMWLPAFKGFLLTVSNWIILDYPSFMQKLWGLVHKKHTSSPFENAYLALMLENH